VVPSRPGVRTVPVSFVVALAEQPLGNELQREPVQLGAPLTQLCTPVVAFDKQAASLPQLPLQLVSLSAQFDQQFIAWPQPSVANPQLWPSVLHVLGVQVTGGVPQRLAWTAPQYSEPVQATPPLVGEQVIVPPQPSAIVPHLPVHDAGWQVGSGPHKLGPARPQASSLAQPPQLTVPPQPSG
jgi:hypothetical protein